MKIEISEKPPSFSAKWPEQYHIFSWMEFVASIPQAIGVVTTYKEGNIPNACPWSWMMYSGDGMGFCIILSLLKSTHTYKNILRDKEFVVNFPSSDEFRRCMDTIKNNSEETDEITASGLNAEPAKTVNAPRIKECFLNLECRLGWHKPLHKGSLYQIVTGEVVHVAIDADRARAYGNGRYGERGYIYNMHSPTDPSTGEEEPTKLGKIEPMYDM